MNIAADSGDHRFEGSDDTVKFILEASKSPLRIFGYTVKINTRVLQFR